MGPSQHAANRLSDQDASKPRQRHCLLKGCDSSFQPTYPFTRYCCADCFVAAQQWSEDIRRVCSAGARRLSQQKANRKYRSSEKGKACRREQSRRYRQRCRERQNQPADPPPEGECEGYLPRCDQADVAKNFLSPSRLLCPVPTTRSFPAAKVL